MTQATDRRRFLGRVAALAAVGSSLSAAGVEPEGGPIPIIDTHQHLWDLKKFRLPWLAGARPLARDFLMDDYLKAAEGLGIVKTVYMEVDVEPSQKREEADHVIDLCRRRVGPLAGAVISGKPSDAGFGDDLARFEGVAAVKGLRQVLHGEGTPPGYCLDPDFVRGIRLLGERGLSFDITMRAAELGDARRLAEACPDTSFILDHCGGASVRAKDLSGWKADIDRLAGRPNVACKISGIVASAAPDPWTAADLAPIVNHALSAFGPDRVVFGGDWPVCTLAATLRQWVEALREIVAERPEIERRKLFHDNALRIYRLG